MLKKILIILAILAGVALVAMLPNNGSRMGADGYQFGTPQYQKDKIEIHVVTYDSRASFSKSAKQYGIKDERVMAFSVLSAPNFDKCTVHMVDPKVEYRPEFIGHEFTHCVYGQWHTDNQSFK